MTPLIFIIFTIYFLILPIYRVHSLISVLHCGEPGHNQHILKRSLAESVMFTNPLSNYNIISSEGKTYSIEYPSSGETAPYKIGH